MFKHIVCACLIMGITLGIGVTGHIHYANLTGFESLLASCTLMSGLGLSIFPESPQGQLFASIYGMFCGYVYIAISGIIIAPIAHRLLHKFHWP